MADKKRDQEYEDLKRQIEIEDMRAELEERKAMRKARAQKADDFADADLKNINAHTDVVQSQAGRKKNRSGSY